MSRTTVSAITAGCFTCHGTNAYWTASNAMACAARHHMTTGHPTWCDRIMQTKWGQQPEMASGDAK